MNTPNSEQSLESLNTVLQSVGATLSPLPWSQHGSLLCCLRCKSLPLIYESKKWSLSISPIQLYLLQPGTCRMLSDDALGSYMRNTPHLLQLLSLSTIFEFDGHSNYIPPLSCHMGPGELQIKLLMLWQPRGCCGPQTPLLLGWRSPFPFSPINTFSKKAKKHGLECWSTVIVHHRSTETSNIF